MLAVKMYMAILHTVLYCEIIFQDYPMMSNMTDMPPAGDDAWQDYEADYDYDLSTWIARRLGPKHLPLSTIVPISTVYAAICAVGVLGNASVCAVICRNKYMQTPTNVYLANLAFSDMLTHLVGKSDCPHCAWHLC